MILCSAQHDKELGLIKIRAAEFPETPADGVDHSGGHVDGAKTTVGGIVWSSKLTREQPGQRLHLISACK